MSSKFERAELIELADAAIEGRLTAAQLTRLESLVTSDRRAAALYVEYVSLEASLRISKGSPIELPRAISCEPLRNTRLPIEAGSTLTDIDVDSTKSAHGSLSLPTWERGGGRGFRVYLQVSLCALAVSVFAIAGIWFAYPRIPKAIAILAETKGCKWDAGTLPTEVGAQLTPGRMRLAEGLARIVFHSGVEVVLESPADFELLSPMQCIVRSGKLVANVPPQAHGFVVETPSSIVTDFGTQFGITVGKDQASIVQVFKGRVDTLHRPSGHTEVMYTGAVLYFGERDYHTHENAEQSTLPDDNVSAEESNENWVQLTTAQGLGADTFVQRDRIPDRHWAKGLLLVKRPAPEEEAWERRAYLAFDLKEIRSSKIAEAELSLTFAPTGLGFAALVPDATFHVYGLRNENSDRWNAAELNWNNAPVCIDASKLSADPRLELLGSFEIPQGEQSSMIRVVDKRLTKLLNDDPNRLATLIVVRDTQGQGPSALVHGIASRRHPMLPPPTLRIRLVDK